MAASDPTLSEYVDAAFQASLDGSSGSDIKALMDPSGKPVAETIDQDGFSAQAFLTPDHQLIVAYAGTDFKGLVSNSEQERDLAVGQVVDDYMLYEGYNPPAFEDGEAFLSQAESVAKDQGVSIAPGNVFVDGHSLGGAIAAYIAAQNSLPGTTFAAPGLPPGDIPVGADGSDVTAYVEAGDPIGNYGYDSDVEKPFVYNEGILRYGTTSYIGSNSLAIGVDADELKLAAATYADNKTLGSVLLAVAAIKNHFLKKYADDLHINIDSLPNGSDDKTDISPQQLIASFQQIVADAKSAVLNVSLDADVSFTDHDTAVLTGTAASPAGVRSVEITAMVDGVETNLGSTAPNADGTFSFTDAVGTHTQTAITATAVDAIGNSASQTAPILLRDGASSPVYGATAGEGDGTAGLPLSRSGSSHVVEVSTSGQTAVSDAYDTFDNHGQSATAFVFTPGFGLDVVRGFKAAGSGHDLLVLPSSDFQNLADVLRNTGDVNGSAFITDPKTGDAIRLAGVTTAELKANRKDLVLA